MSQTNLNPKAQIIAKIVVPIVVALLGAGGFWQILQNRNDSQACQINVNDISLSKTVIEANQSLEVSIRADNPDGKPLLYNWQAVNGKMNPGLRSASSLSRYTAPPDAVDDTISVDVTLPGCKPVRKSKPISVTSPSSSTPTPLKRATLVLPTSSINSSPSPQPIQRNSVVYQYQQNFEGNLETNNECDPKDSAPTDGRTGQGLKVTYHNKPWGCRSFQLPGVFEAGKTYQASVWCKANREARCMLFFGDDKKDDTKAYEHEDQSEREGNSEWQQLTTRPIKMHHDERMSVYVYSPVPRTSATYDDILVEEVVNQ